MYLPYNDKHQFLNPRTGLSLIVESLSSDNYRTIKIIGSHGGIHGEIKLHESDISVLISKLQEETMK